MKVASALVVHTPFWFRAVAGLACTLVACADGSSAAPELKTDVCRVAAGSRPLEALPEASGLALSRQTAGVLWSHNDSGQPVLVAFDTTGATRGRVRIPNATIDDWEDVTAARCPAGNCLYIADIGDNNGVRPTVILYRIPEPQPQEKQSAAAEIFTARYPDGAHDAEALFAVGEDLFLVTKEATSIVYRFPRPLRTGGPMALERVAELPLRRVTDAETSADGAWVAIRTNDEVALYRVTDVARGGQPAVLVALKPLQEPQGEGVALDANGMLYLTSEAGGEKRAGSLLTLRCTLPSAA